MTTADATRRKGQPVPGYRQEAGVAAQSQTETFVALRTEISNWRWAGVPFFIRTGKRLAGREASIVVHFRQVPHAIYRTPMGAANRLVIHLQPKDGLTLHLMAAAQSQGDAGGVQTLSPAALDLDFDQLYQSKDGWNHSSL